jgi:hypothetical protein
MNITDKLTQSWERLSDFLCEHLFRVALFNEFQGLIEGSLHILEQ